MQKNEPSIQHVPDEDDLVLVDRVLAGDRRAFESLVRRHERRIFRVSFAVLGNVEDAEEAMQDGLYFVFPQPLYSVFGFIDPSDRFTDQTLAWLTQLHFGRFGWFAEAFWTVLGMMPAVLALTGVFLCCRRMIYKIPPARP
jgi:hypothetical protein